MNLSKSGVKAAMAACQKVVASRLGGSWHWRSWRTKQIQNMTRSSCLEKSSWWEGFSSCVKNWYWKMKFTWKRIMASRSHACSRRSWLTSFAANKLILSIFSQWKRNPRGLNLMANIKRWISNIWDLFVWSLSLLIRI